ncbi:hypothetical protein BC939DRAFT_221246 [Gamsiella multidivaricata]|uniref:uncharacterized protein n=1 Tax=Gamsiella multidivaricata TaxID=101098 RepID=UPI00222075CD|nr:uncharacterized protein BC939DRAFT_221246 [Gamsiella multidivaricata]KAG0355098.1 hypothetical protein BGZ54_001297 [Gamsiella multidivaricata]KAI7831153.1 hypothetical protein BC939DRAFT_221246 [Gamsiella multidivaricata]
MPPTADPLWEGLSSFGSGLKHLWEAFRYKHGRNTKRTALSLAVRCLIIQTIVNGLTYIFPRCYRIVNQLFFPIILLYRYVHPEPWDNLFIATVRALGCSERSDVLAKPKPQRFSQARQYCARLFKVMIGMHVIDFLVTRSGILYLPSAGLGLVAVDQILQYRGIKSSLWKIAVLSLFTGPRWPVLVVQTLLLQQLLMYELLQPYLARVNFKGWEERVWMSQYELELQGFAIGAWYLCSIPWIGVALIPLMFPAVAFLLTRSCGFMENTRNGAGDDMIERRYPGVKTVALGKSKSVSGDWEETKVNTFVRGTDTKAFKPEKHNTKNSATYILDCGHDEPVEKCQIQKDKEASQVLRMGRYRDVEERIKHMRIHPSSPSNGWDPRLSFGSPSTRHSPFSGSQLSTEQTSTLTPSITTTPQEDLTKYNFSDRKTFDSAPSAPSEQAVIETETAVGQGDVFRETPYTDVDSDSVDFSAAHKANMQEHDMQAKEAKRQAKEAKRQAIEAKQRAMEMKRRAIEQKRTAKAMGKKEMRRASSIRKGDPEASKEKQEARETGETQEKQEEEEEAQEEEEEVQEEEWNDYYRPTNEHGARPFDTSRGRGRGRGGPWGWHGVRGGRGGWDVTRGVNRGRRRHHEGSTGEVMDVTTEQTSLSTIISQGVQSIEAYMGELLLDVGTQVAEKLRAAVVDPDNPQRFQIHLGEFERDVVL